MQGQRMSKGAKGKQCDYHNLAPSQILQDTFCSRLFMIRYSEEEIELQDLCIFCTEVDIYPKRSLDTCYLSIELYFADNTVLGPPELLDAEV
jgi:hypothetical protein